MNLEEMNFRNNLIRSKRDKFCGAIAKAVESFDLKMPEINFGEYFCPGFTDDELAHYHPDTNKICVSRESITTMDYPDLESTAIHEICHQLEQSHDSRFTRIKSEISAGVFNASESNKNAVNKLEIDKSHKKEKVIRSNQLVCAYLNPAINEFIAKHHNKREKGRTRGGLFQFIDNEYDSFYSLAEQLLKIRDKLYCDVQQKEVMEKNDIENIFSPIFELYSTIFRNPEIDRDFLIKLRRLFKELDADSGTNFKSRITDLHFKDKKIDYLPSKVIPYRSAVLIPFEKAKLADYESAKVIPYKEAPKMSMPSKIIHTLLGDLKDEEKKLKDRIDLENEEIFKENQLEEKRVEKANFEIRKNNELEKKRVKKLNDEICEKNELEKKNIEKLNEEIRKKNELEKNKINEKVIAKNALIRASLDNSLWKIRT